VGFASDKVQGISRYFGAGLILDGLNPIRTEDTLGIAVATAVSADDLGIRSAEYHETSIELTYSAQLTPWLRLQPGVQYIFNPGFDPRLEDALVFGLRVEASSTIAGLL